MELFLDRGLIVLAGPAGSGKSYWAEEKFSEYIISADAVREMISDDNDNQNIHKETFETVNFLIKQRLKLDRPTIVDSTALIAEDRQQLIKLAVDTSKTAQLIVFDVDYETCWESQNKRDRHYPKAVLDKHFERMRQLKEDRDSGELDKEGFTDIYWLDRDQADSAKIIWNIEVTTKHF